MDYDQLFRCCALCRYFELKEEGYEFEGVEDTYFLKYRCRLLGCEGREDPLMESDPQFVFEDPRVKGIDGCPFFEPLPSR